MRLSAVSRIPVLLLIFFAVSTARAQNLVTNGGFATDTSGWTSFGSGNGADGARAWNSSDAAGAAGSGSVQLTLSDTSALGTLIGVAQCIPATPGTTYQFFASLNSPSAQTSESRGIVEAAFFSDAGCTTALNFADGQGALKSAVPPTSPPWRTMPGGASAGGFEVNAIAPAGTASLEIRLYAERTATGAPSSQQDILFDSVVLHTAGSTPVSLTTFAAE